CTPTNFDIVNCTNEILTELQHVAKEKQQADYQHSGKTTEVYLDQKLYRNILINLISNAIKFSNDDGLIEIRTKVDHSNITIVVKDSGIGIAKEDQQHLFERFFRAQNATNIQGTGLGLNIVAKYIELMNGTITFESELNKGTTFTIKFALNS
ncbi:MAG: sensor histidine kinase, partial [Bacteroidia bacterium]|nr:sensor histidine kinase [Bacteroidia bacterium]